MKIFLFVSMAFCLMLGNALTMKAQWVAQTSGTTDDLFSVYFTDALNGWAVGDSGIILNTTNGGIDWVPQVSNTTSDLYSIHFENTNNGWISGDSGTMLKYNGTNWTSQNTHTTAWLMSVFFTDANNGIASGGAFWGYSRMIKTNNGGLTWDTLSTSNSSYSGNSLFFINPLSGWKTNWNKTISKTVDGGITWSVQNKGDDYSIVLHSLYFVDDNTGFAVGDSGTILKTIDGGDSWVSKTQDSSKFLWSVFFVSANVGYVVGIGGVILKTSDGGESWTSQTSNTNVDLFSVFFTDLNTGYAVGDSGTILKISNANNINETALNPIRFEVYPNPATDIVTIDLNFDQKTDTKIGLFDVVGQRLELISDFGGNKDQITFNVGELPNGLYLIKVTDSEGRSVSKKLMK